MSDLTYEEQQRVRATLHHLRRRKGGWEMLAAELGCRGDSLERVASGRRREVSASLAFRVARLADVRIDDLLSGRYRAGACPRCGHMPDWESGLTVIDGGLS